jgi:hypothetical protein
MEFFGHPAAVQGLYYFGTGIWPLLHMRSFMKVTGPKVDEWLVNCVGALLSVTGLVLLWAERAGDLSPPLAALAMGQALVLTAIDVRYALSRRISRIYLGDAIVEIFLVGLWLVRWQKF